MFAAQAFEKKLRQCVRVHPVLPGQEEGVVVERIADPLGLGIWNEGLRLGRFCGFACCGVLVEFRKAGGSGPHQQFLFEAVLQGLVGLGPVQEPCQRPIQQLGAGVLVQKTDQHLEPFLGLPGSLQCIGKPHEGAVVNGGAELFRALGEFAKAGCRLGGLPSDEGEAGAEVASVLVVLVGLTVLPVGRGHLGEQSGCRIEFPVLEEEKGVKKTSF